ncbi:MAG: DUF433 domain-containing protein [Trueperaceae bacterium]|nr:DUF433 domain-containing protein [Trueperaceae bacterium]
MCARTPKPRSTARGLRLPSALAEAVQREADLRGSTWSALTTELLDEALRQRRAPGVAFVDGATGRRAVVAGTALEVWEVVAAWKDADEDLARTTEAFPWLTELQVRAAIGYYLLYLDDVDRRLAREEAWTAERLRRELPFAVPRPT